MKDKVEEIFDNAFFDQIQIAYTPKGSDVAQYFASGEVDKECFLNVLNMDNSNPFVLYNSTTKCTPTTYIAQMQLQESYVRDIFVDAVEEWELNDTIKMYNKMKLKKIGKMKRDSDVNWEEMGNIIENSYNTIWSCIFTLDSMKEVNNEIWLI